MSTKDQNSKSGGYYMDMMASIRKALSGTGQLKNPSQENITEEQDQDINRDTADLIEELKAMDCKVEDPDSEDMKETIASAVREAIEDILEDKLRDMIEDAIQDALEDRLKDPLSECLSEELEKYFANTTSTLPDGTTIKARPAVRIISPDKKYMVLCYGGLKVQGYELYVQTGPTTWEPIGYFYSEEGAIEALEKVSKAMDQGLTLIEL